MITKEISNFWRNDTAFRSTSTGMNENVLRGIFLSPSLSAEEKGYRLKKHILKNRETYFRKQNHNAYFENKIIGYMDDLKIYGVTYIDTVGQVSEMLRVIPHARIVYVFGKWKFVSNSIRKNKKY